MKGISFFVRSIPYPSRESIVFRAFDADLSKAIPGTVHRVLSTTEARRVAIQTPSFNFVLSFYSVFFPELFSPSSLQREEGPPSCDATGAAGR